MMVDVAVVGGGLVGAASAVALSRQGLQVVLLDNKPADTGMVGEEWDSRIYAITPGNIAWLKSLNVWDRMDQARICSIQRMQVWGDANSRPLQFDAYDTNVAELGVTLESGRLLKALWEEMQAQNVEVLAGAGCEAISMGAEAASLILADGSRLNARLIVAADGGNSWVRGQLNVGVDFYDYQQMGLVANFETELPHQFVARQWFREDGILAWLPMPGNRISIVWSTTHAKAKHLLGLSPEDIAEEVAAAGGNILGSLKMITPATAFPLVLQTSHKLALERIVLVGDAAHRVHPMAGQGVNLGFRDVAELAKVLSGRSVYQDIGDAILLRRYERARKADMLGMRGVTHGLYHLFGSEQPALKKLRNWGLQVTEGIPAVKKQLVRHAMI